MKDRKQITWVLAVLALCIWGAIAYQLLRARSGEENVIIPDRLASRSAPSRYRYRSDTRDPFYSSPGPHRRFGNTQNSSLQLTAPRVKLAGILGHRKRKTALIESPDGSVHFLAEGDTLDGVRVLRIKTNTVTYAFRHKNGQWQLEESKR